jgi:nucleotide-binding universal stress UspA family protein
MFDATLHIMHVNVLFGENSEKNSKGFPETEKLLEYYEKLADYEFEDVRKISEEHEIRFEEKTVRGFSVAEEILQYEKTISAEMIVMGTHGRGILSHFVLGSVAEKVVRYSSCPVITVNQFGKSIDIGNNYKKILVPLDFSDYSKAGLKYGISLAKKFNAKIDILHVFESFPPPLIYHYGASSQLQFNPEIKDRSTEVIENIVNEIDNDFKNYKSYVIEGKPNREIANHSQQEDTDLIVLSTRGLGTVQAFFIGSTADKVIRRAKCPVLAVKEHEREFVH